MKAGLTPKQAELLAYLDEFTAREGHSPSFDQMTTQLGLSSKSGVSRLIDALEERGCIIRLPNRARAISVVGGKASALDEQAFPPAVERALGRMCSETGAPRSTVIRLAVAAFLGVSV